MSSNRGDSLKARQLFNIETDEDHQDERQQSNGLHSQADTMEMQSSRPSDHGGQLDIVKNGFIDNNLDQMTEISLHNDSLAKSKLAINIQNVAFSYATSKPVLKNITLLVPEGEFILESYSRIRTRSMLEKNNF